MVASTHKVRFAVVGCGHIGKRHAEMICNNAESILTAIIDIQDSRSEESPIKSVPFFYSLESFLNDPIADETDVINIATPNGIHAEQAILCLSAGKHVVIEKPVALNAADARRIIACSEEKGKLVFAVMQNRYSPPSRWIKELVSSGKLGQLYMVQLSCYWNRDTRYYKNDSWHGTKDLDGGTLFTQFSHFIDLMYWLFGDLQNISGRLVDNNHEGLTDFEDSGYINFEFSKGGIGCLNYSTSVWDKNMESSITILAENGSVKIGGQYMDKLEYCHVKDYFCPELPPTNEGNDYGAYKGSAANHHFVIENVIDVLKDRASVTTTAEEGLKVVEIIENIYSTVRFNKKIANNVYC